MAVSCHSECGQRNALSLAPAGVGPGWGSCGSGGCPSARLCWCD